MFQRSSDPFNLASYYIKWVNTSWTHSMRFLRELNDPWQKSPGWALTPDQEQEGLKELVGQPRHRGIHYAKFYGGGWGEWEWQISSVTSASMQLYKNEFETPRLHMSGKVSDLLDELGHLTSGWCFLNLQYIYRFNV